MFDTCVTNMINRFGQTVKVVSTDDTDVYTKAFIQPLRYKDQTYMGGKCMDMGYFNGTNYLYIGDKNTRLDLYPFNTMLKTDDQTYVIKRAQAVYLGEDVLYVWAIIQVYVEDSL